MAKNLTVFEKRCEDCENCKTINGKMCCTDLWDRACNDIAEDECPEEITIKDVQEITEKTKDVKIQHGAKADKPKKERKAPARKPDEEKEHLISLLSELLENLDESEKIKNVTIKNKSKLIEFKIGETTYKLDLIRVRGAKAKA